jgi:serine/threonine-protein kinase RsbW
VEPPAIMMDREMRWITVDVDAGVRHQQIVNLILSAESFVMQTRHVSPWTSRQTIPSDTAIGSELVHSLLAAMAERDWPSVELFHVQLAYEEAIVNAIVHGNRAAADKTVQVEMTCDGDSVWIQITDQGAGFDPAAVPDPTQDDLLEAPGGRGVLLITEVMSEVTYNERGNQVTLKKTRSAEVTGSAD